MKLVKALDNDLIETLTATTKIIQLQIKQQP